MQTQNKFILYCALPFLVVLSYSSNVYFLPALPTIAHLLNATDAQEKLAFPLLLLGGSFSCFFIGALADAYGAKKVMIGQLVVLLTGVMICVLADSMRMFLVGIFVQGLGNYGTILVKYIKVNFSEDTTKLLSVLFLIGCVFIPVMMTISGYLCHFYSWVDVFWFQFFMSLIVLFFMSVLPTNPDVKLIQLSVKKYCHDLGYYWSHPAFYSALILCMAIGGALSVFYTLSPHIIIVDFQRTPAEYGLLMFIPIVGRLMGNGLNYYLAERLSKDTIITVGKIIALMTICSYVVIYYFLPSPFTIMLHVAVLMLAWPMVRTNAMLNVMSINPILAGSALAFLTLGVKTIYGVSALLAAHRDGEMMGLLMLIIVVVGALLHTLIHRLDVRSQKKA